jgi:hypothetical protein
MLDTTETEGTVQRSKEDNVRRSVGGYFAGLKEEVVKYDRIRETAFIGGGRRHWGSSNRGCALRAIAQHAAINSAYGSR